MGKAGESVSCCRVRYEDGEAKHADDCPLSQAQEEIRRGVGMEPVNNGPSDRDPRCPDCGAYTSWLKTDGYVLTDDKGKSLLFAERELQCIEGCGWSGGTFLHTPHGFDASPISIFHGDGVIGRIGAKAKAYEDLLDVCWRILKIAGNGDAQDALLCNDLLPFEQEILEMADSLARLRGKPLEMNAITNHDVEPRS